MEGAKGRSDFCPAWDRMRTLDKDAVSCEDESMSDSGADTGEEIAIVGAGVSLTLDDGGLDRHVATNQLDEHRGVEVTDCSHVGQREVEQLVVADHGVLDALREPTSKRSIRQGLQHIGVCHTSAFML